MRVSFVFVAALFATLYACAAEETPSASAFISLKKGVVHNGSTGSTGSAFYQLFVETELDMKFTVSKGKDATPAREQSTSAAVASTYNGQEGSASASPTVSVYITTRMNSTHPVSASTAMWRFEAPLEAAGGRGVVIPTSDPRFCKGCSYYVGVSGPLKTAFSVVVSTPAPHKKLRVGAPVPAEVKAGEYVYYKVHLRHRAKLTISVEVCAGNPDLYISQIAYEPTLVDHEFTSAYSDREDEVVLKGRSIKEYSTYYVGVYGASAELSAFLLTATLGEGRTRGLPKLPIHPNNGALQVEPQGAGTLMIVVPTAASSVGTAANFMEYTVHYAPRSANAVMYSMCGLRTDAVKQHGAAMYPTEDQRMFAAVITDLSGGVAYDISVMVKDTTSFMYAVYMPLLNVRVPSDNPGLLEGGKPALQGECGARSVKRNIPDWTDPKWGQDQEQASVQGQGNVWLDPPAGRPPPSSVDDPSNASGSNAAGSASVPELALLEDPSGHRQAAMDDDDF